MAELFLELLSEEVPARMQLPMLDTIEQKLTEKLKETELYHSQIHSYVTPRRMTFVIEGLSLTQEDKVSERKGPRTDAPEQAIEGFLKSTGLTLDALAKRKTDKGEFYFAIIQQKGLPTKEILANILQELLPSITWPKSMYWGSSDIRWVRPLKNICCLFGGEILPISFGHLRANDLSYGHRFLSPDSFPVRSFDSYKAELKKRFVILDHAERKEQIHAQATTLAKEHNVQLEEDEGLLREVAGLVEWPEVLLGNIEQELMDIPEECLISSIRTHQKYFCTRNADDTLAPYFLVVSNMKTEDQGKHIIAGNEKVLKARLADANFFWQQDKKQPLEDNQAGLERLIFHAQLGTVAEKVNRIQGLAKFLSVWVPHANLEVVEHAALLCKSDLVSEMVLEFPELQGIMGYYYALESEKEKDIAIAIREHYAPLGPKDTCPVAPTSVAIALADKIDSLVGLFAIDEKPTGSKDPYALRRAALGVIRIILENNLSVPLRLLCETALKNYPASLFKHKDGEEGKQKIIEKLKPGKKNKGKPEETVQELLLFFAERLKALLKDRKVRHDLITAVFDEGSEDDMLRLVQRVEALDSFLTTDDGINLFAAYKRAMNIVKIEEKKDDAHYTGTPAKHLLEQEEEKILFEKLQEIRPEIKKALKENAFSDAMSLLSKLRGPIDAFFDKVTVNCKHADVRRNRLILLSQMREQLHDIANFSYIEIGQ